MADPNPDVPLPGEATAEERARRQAIYDQLNVALVAKGAWPLVAERDAEIVYVEIERIPGFENLPDFDLRNGDPLDVRPLLVRPTIPKGYHWVPVGGVESADAVDSVDAYIMSAMYQMRAFGPANATESVSRKRAIILGTSRAVATKHYRLTKNDFISGEVASPVLQRIVTRGPDDRDVMHHVPLVANADPNRKYLVDPLNLSEVEKAIVSTLLLSSLGTPALQGYSLMMCGHHYLSDAGSISRRAYGVVEKQFWGANAVKTWFTDDILDAQDCAWHKSCHPISLQLKEEFACNPTIALMLREAGAGSAASRLPALESELRCASSYVALLSTVHPLFAMFGGGVNYKILTDLIGDIKAVARTGDLEEVPTYWPPRVRTRKDALEWLGEVNQRSAGVVAYCYGFYVAMAEQSQTLAGAGAPDTLRSSFSLNKLRNQSPATYVDGTEAFRDYAAARNRKRMDGEYVAATFELQP